LELIILLLALGFIWACGFRWLERTKLGFGNRRGKRVGYIYVFRGKNESLRLCKIGRAKRVEERMKSHRTANPHGVHLLAVIKVGNDVNAEAYLHNRFEQTRLSRDNEWFYLTPGLWLYLQLIKDRGLTRRTQAALD
jgi:hypothetical protein